MNRQNKKKYKPQTPNGEIYSKNKLSYIFIIFQKKFASNQKYLYFCIRFEKGGRNNAEIAQLVEHNLAKVGVAGSSPVFRS